MRRREFIAGLGSAAAWPVVVRAQQPAMPVIGYLGAQSADDDYKNFTVPFLQGLKESGYVEGQNVAVEYRWADNQYDRLPALAADLVRLRVEAIHSDRDSWRRPSTAFPARCLTPGCVSSNPPSVRTAAQQRTHLRAKGGPNPQMMGRGQPEVRSKPLSQPQ